MKKIFQIVCCTALVALMGSCAEKNHFTINGTLDGNALDGRTVYLVDGSAASTPIDSTVVENGAFRFSGEVLTPWRAVVAIGREFTQTLIVEPGEISLQADHIGGTPLNEALSLYLKSLQHEDLEAEMSTYLQLYYSAPSTEARADAERRYDSVEAIALKRIADTSWKVYEAQRENILGAFAMEQIAMQDGMTLSTLDSILGTASEVVASHKPLLDKREQMRCVDATSAGRHYTDLPGTIIKDGVSQADGHLSDLIDGHLALVDFYASWCGPCRNEIRDNIVPLYAKYRSKGLVVVGLNVWERGNREAREAAHSKVMADLGISYPQLVDSTRTATDTYGVRGIPQIMLIGPDGTILARDLRGNAIEEAIVKAL